MPKTIDKKCGFNESEAIIVAKSLGRNGDNAE